MFVLRRAMVRAGLFPLAFLLACGDGGGGATGPQTSVATTVSVTPSSMTLDALGATTQFSASVKDQSGQAMSGAAVSWTSSNTSVATVNSSGLAAAVSDGTTTITARSGSASGTASLTVTQAVASVEVTPGGVTLSALDETQQLSASARDALGNEVTGASVVWASSDESVATVDATGIVTAQANGSATVTATAGQISGSATVTVETNEIRIGPEGGTFLGANGQVGLQIPAGAVGQSTIITIEVASNPPASDRLVPGTAYDFGPDGTQFNNPVQLSIAYVPANIPAGVAEADLRLYRAEGAEWEAVDGSLVDVATKSVTGSVQGFSTYAILGLPRIPVASVKVSPASAQVLVGGTVVYSAQVLDESGTELFGRAVTWDTGDHSIATVNGVGMVTGIAEGATTVTASVGLVSGSAAVTVSQVGPGTELQWETQVRWSEFYDVWGSSSSDVFAVGRWGVILHFDGTSWVEQSSLSNVMGSDLHGVWGSSSSDVFAVGGWYSQRILHYDGETWSVVHDWGNKPGLKDVWGSSASDVFAVGDGGTILHFDGVSWSEQASGTTAYLTGVWGSSSKDVFAVGDDGSGTGVILHYDGTAWTVQDHGMTGYLTLQAVWGTSSTDVFVVGRDHLGHGLILHYDGTTWSPQTSGTMELLDCVWGSSPTDVFVGGGNYNDSFSHSVILHYDGTGWREQIGGTDLDVTGLWGSSSTDVFAVSDRGVILHYDGASWSSNAIWQTGWVNDIWGTSSTNVLAVGQNHFINSELNTGYKVLNYDGTNWGDQAAEYTFSSFSGIWGSSRDDVFAVGTDARSYNPSKGDKGLIYHFDGTSWSPQTIGAPTRGLFDVWGSSSADVFAVGWDEGTGVILHYDGTSWNAQDIGMVFAVVGVWGSSPTDVFAVGAGGQVLHYDGASWSPQTTPTERALLAVWGSSATNVFAVGERGTILHYDGTEWSSQSGTWVDLFAVWGSSSTDVFAVGERGVIVHYDGIKWSFQDSGVTSDLLSVWGSSSTDVFVGGENGIILRGRR